VYFGWYLGWLLSKRRNVKGCAVAKIKRIAVPLSIDTYLMIDTWNSTRPIIVSDILPSIPDGVN
jgi:hypothetical protein